MDERSFYKKIEGVEEDGTSRAMCNLAIVGPDGDDDPIELGTAVALNGAVYLSIIPGGLSMIDVMFEDHTDYDYLKMAGLCDQYNKMVADANANATEVPSLTLVVSEKGELAMMMSCVGCAWSYMATSPDKPCSGLRFIVQTDHIHFLEFNDEQITKILDELEDEELSE